MRSITLVEFWSIFRHAVGDFSAVVRFDGYTERMRYFYHPYGGHYRVCKDTDKYDNLGRLIR